VSNDVEIETIDHLDFDFEPPCEHSQHVIYHTEDQPAAWLAKSGKCPVCGGQTPKSQAGYLICDEGRRTFSQVYSIKCILCGMRVKVEDWNFVFTPIND